jgi:hypothetical protein
VKKDEKETFPEVFFGSVGAVGGVAVVSLAAYTYSYKTTTGKGSSVAKKAVVVNGNGQLAVVGNTVL